MPKYRVSTYATPEGAVHMNNSIHRQYVVEAADEQGARMAAIDAAYAEGGLDHVNPRAVTLLAEVATRRYIPLLRPPGFATLPGKLEWAYVEVPSYITKRPDLPKSSHPHGVIECRELTADEMSRFDLRAI